MKTPILLWTLVATSLVTFPSLADEKAACLEATDKGQTLRRDHKLVEAREQFLVCSRKECPAVVQKDCTRWLESMGAQIPTVVLSAKDGAGTDLIAVNVTVDGVPFKTKLDGQAASMNPGPHTFHFELPDGTRADKEVLVNEGQKNLVVDVVLKKEGATPPATATATSQPPPSTSGSSPWKTVGWVTGGVGVVGLAVGTVFGFVAINDKNSAGCSGVTHTCVAGPLSSAHSAATGSDIGLIAGGVLLAAGVGLVLFGPSTPKEGTATVRLVPEVAAGGGGLVLGGRW